MRLHTRRQPWVALCQTVSHCPPHAAFATKARGLQVICLSQDDLPSMKSKHPRACSLTLLFWEGWTAMTAAPCSRFKMSVRNFVYPTVHNSPRGPWVRTLLTQEWWNVTISAGGSITTLKLAISEKNWPPEKLLHNAFPDLNHDSCNKRIWHTTCQPLCPL